MEISLFKKLKEAYAESIYGAMSPEVTDVLFRQKDNQMEIVVQTNEKGRAAHPAELGFMMEEEIAKEWRLNAGDPIELNANRFLYGHTPMLLNLLKIIKESDYPGTELIDEPSEIMIQELLRQKEGGEGIHTDLTECSVSIWDESKGDSVVAVFQVKPTVSGIEIKEKK